MFQQHQHKLLKVHQLKQYLKDNPKLLEEIEKKVRDNFEKAFEQSLGEELPEDEDEEEE